MGGGARASLHNETEKGSFDFNKHVAVIAKDSLPRRAGGWAAGWRLGRGNGMKSGAFRCENDWLEDVLFKTISIVLEIVIVDVQLLFAKPPRLYCKHGKAASDFHFLLKCLCRAKLVVNIKFDEEKMSFANLWQVSWPFSS